MFKIKDSTIHCSRGDRGMITLRVPIIDTNDYIQYNDENETTYWYNTKNKKIYNSNHIEVDKDINNLTMCCYKFKAGDKVTFNVYEKNGYNKEPLMSKDIMITDETEEINIILTEDDTTFGNPINKETIFWYDITLNDDLTVVCYDENGAKEFIQYPSKGGND